VHEERTRPASSAAEAPAVEERLTYTLNEAARRLGISRALAYEAAGQHGRAKQDLERVYAQDPSYEDVRERLASSASG